MRRRVAGRGEFWRYKRAMSKPTSRHPAVPYIGGTLIWAYMSLLAHTMRWRVEGIDHLAEAWKGPKGWIAATWHSRILMMPMVQVRYRPKWPKPPHPPTLMVSNSKDGEFTNRAGRLLGLHIVRGSRPTPGKEKTEGKRGLLGAREAMQVLLKGGGMVLTIDGPKGPPEEVDMGSIKLAQQVGAPILCYGLSAHARRLDTWDRLLFPKPFARGAVVIAKPIETSKGMDSEALRLEVQQTLKDVTARADMLAGQTDTAPAQAPATSPAPPAPDGALEQSGS